MPATYHQDKSKLAKKYKYHCIHIWDWDDIDKVMALVVQSKIKIPARKCNIQSVSENDCNKFLKTHHLQNSCRNQKIRLGLYFDDELVEIMTFGTPRYNKNYEYELLRLCSRSDVLVIGGAEKLWKFFINTYQPKSVISYCDNSKFSGNVYSRLGFTLLSYGSPSKHWYNMKTGQHITDNLLRQRGYDQLFNTTYGKGISNEQLMKEHNFVEIYDCGQSTYVIKF